MELVREHINFERGIDPKKAMSIGTYALRDKIDEWMASIGKGGLDDDHALMAAARAGKTLFVKYLLDEHFQEQMDASVYVENYFPIRWAAINGHEEVVKILANPKYKMSERDWDYIIERVEKQGFPEAVKLLKKYRY